MGWNTPLHDFEPRLLQVYPYEVLFLMRLSYEEIYHGQALSAASQIQPGQAITPPGTMSNGNARSDRNVGIGILPIVSFQIRYWRASLKRVDDVYGQPYPGVGKEFTIPPFETLASVKFDESSDKQVQTMEYGQQFTFTATARIPVFYHIINELPEPVEGDLLEFWSDSRRDFGVFYNVTKVEKKGRIHSSVYHTEWLLTLARNEEFLPERRLMGQR
jgi:hypothetical protein